MRIRRSLTVAARWYLVNFLEVHQAVNVSERHFSTGSYPFILRLRIHRPASAA